MKSTCFSLLLGLMLWSCSLIAQPSASPFSKLEQKAGTTDITVEYSRPSLKGRTIFPDLHKYGETWRTGANAATKVTFSEDVTVEGKALPAGSYALLTKPGKDKWEVMFFAYDQASVSSYSSAAPKVSVSVDAAKAGRSVETFQIDIQDLRDDSATLSLSWGTDYIGVKLGVK